VAALDIKLVRDLRRMWAQSLAIAFVVAGGVASLVMAVGSLTSLQETRIAYYERLQFADVFALVRRAPRTLLTQIAEIPGVAATEGRIAKLALLDVPDIAEPATGQFISLPDGGQPRLNQLYMRGGRLPLPTSEQEVVVSDGFAKAHHFELGSRFWAILNGRKRELVIVGSAMSPEFIYTMGPGDRMPDDRRFTIVWMPEKALASAYDLDGAFSSVNLKLLPEASEPEVVKRLDGLLDRYGGQAAYGRRDQFSHAYINHGMDMLRNMSTTLPPIFLLVAAFLINLTLTRIVALEREQIGLFKALGYSNRAIALHYVKFVMVIVAVGIAVGAAAGNLLGSYVTRLYGDIVHFPFLIFAVTPGVYVLAGALSLVAGVGGAVHALRGVVGLPPAVAMQPPAPPRFRRLLPVAWSPRHLLSQPLVMMARNLTGHPFRAGLTMVGLSLSTGILVASLFLGGTMENLIDVTFFLADRQDGTVSFVDRRNANVVEQVAHLPGVIATEPYREVPVRIRKGPLERRVMLNARPGDADLSRVVDVNLRAVTLPEGGLAISSRLGRLIGAKPGDVVEIDLLEGRHRTLALPVTALVEDYFGIQAMMEGKTLSRLMREAPAVNAVNVSLDASRLEEFYRAIKGLPAVAGLTLQKLSLVNFRRQMAAIVTTMASIYTGLAALIAFGVVYNSARISLSERARELASLRVLGFTHAEVLRILLLELALLTVLAQPAGWAIGYGLAWLLKTRMEGDVMRARLVVDNLTYALASSMVMAAALFSAIAVRQRVARLDLVSVLKTRD
jgi:putative ABC transport system permease protein